MTQESALKRRTVALGDETFKIVSDWKGKTRLEENSNVVQAAREFLRWFITTHLKNEWQSIALDASLELSVAGVLAGSVAGSLGVTLVTLAGGTILKAVVMAPRDVLPDELKIAFFVIFFLLMVGCLIVVFKPRWFILPNEQPTASNSPPPIPPSTQLLPNSTPTVVAFPTMAVIPPTPTLTPTALLPVNTMTINNSPNYCLYVVQLGDTIQSVASWFYVSENDIRNSDNLVGKDVFTLHQLIKVNAPCCTHIGVSNGFSYSVEPKDNVYRLALNFSTSVETIVFANNLGDSRYIQTGQMLCIPHP